jgi:chorismate synthase
MKQSVNVSGSSSVRVEIDVIDVTTGATIGSTTGSHISWLGPNATQPSSDTWQIRVHIPGSASGSGNFQIDVVDIANY